MTVSTNILSQVNLKMSTLSSGGTTWIWSQHCCSLHELSVMDLHLHSFSWMLPYFMRYDHLNYARWALVYIAEMHQLPEPVLSEFQRGNSVVKRSDQRFNQVDPDQAMVWINGTGKEGGGIIGITKTPSALSRWSPTT